MGTQQNRLKRVADRIEGLVKKASENTLLGFIKNKVAPAHQRALEEFWNTWDQYNLVIRWVRKESAKEGNLMLERAAREAEHDWLALRSQAEEMVRGHLKEMLEAASAVQTQTIKLKAEALKEAGNEQKLLEVLRGKAEPAHAKAIKDLDAAFKAYENLMRSIASLGQKANNIALKEGAEMRANRVKKISSDLLSNIGDDLRVLMWKLEESLGEEPDLDL